MKRWGEPFYEDSALSTDDVLARAQVAVVVVDRLSRLRYWNSYAVELFGFVDGQEHIGTSLLDLGIHEADRELAGQLARRVLAGESWEGTFAVVRGDATWLHVRARAVPLRLADGTIDGVVIVADEAMRTGRVEEQYGLLERISNRLASSLEFGPTLRSVAEILVPQFADHCFIDLYDHDALVRRVSVHAEGWTPPPGSWIEAGEEVHYPEEHFVHQALRRMETVVVGEGLHDSGIAPNPRSARVSRQVGVTSAVAAPLRVRGELLGVLTLALSSLSVREKRYYNGFDRDLVGAIASRVALAIDNSRLFEEERNTALAFQQGLLPREFPEFDGLSIAHRYVPAKPLENPGHGIQTQVGGDFYDVIPLSAGRVGIVIGDVEGRGPHAAAVMGQVRAAIRAFAQADREPAEIMRELDEWVRQLGVPDDKGGTWVPSVSCLYLIYDAWSRELYYANAGHAAPLLLVDGEVTDLAIEVSDILLGVKVKGVPYDDAVYHQAALTLPPGATLLLYTDGLVDRRPIGGDIDIERSLTHLRARLREVQAKDVQQLAEAALQAVPGETSDDTALLVVRSNPDELALREQWFVAEAATVADSRHLAAMTFDRWGMDDEQSELACLLVSEVVTNVVLHATPTPKRREITPHGAQDDSTAEEFSEDWSDLLEEVGAQPPPAEPRREFLLRLRRGASSIWVEVFDHDLRLPRIRSAGADDEGGRGLYLVDQLATRWGSRPTSDGKFVWFEIPMHGE